MAHQLQKGVSAQIGSTAALWAGGSRKITGAQYNQQLLAQYNAYVGQKKNSIVPGVGNFYAAKSPTLSPAQQRRTDLFTAAMGSGPGLAALSGKAVDSALGAIGRANSAKSGQSSGQAAPPLPQRGTPARPVSETGTRAEYARGRQQARVAAYDPARRTDAQLQKDLKPDVRPGETPQQARQRVDFARKEIFKRPLQFTVDKSMRRKILWGEQKVINGISTKQTIGGHFSGIIGHPNYSVEKTGISIINANSDTVKYVKGLPGGEVSKIKSPHSTLFPRGWSEDKIIRTIEKIANRWYGVSQNLPNNGRQITARVDGLEIVVIIRDSKIMAGYPK